MTMDDSSIEDGRLALRNVELLSALERIGVGTDPFVNSAIPRIDPASRDAVRRQTEEMLEQRVAGQTDMSPEILSAVIDVYLEPIRRATAFIAVKVDGAYPALTICFIASNSSVVLTWLSDETVRVGREDAPENAVSRSIAGCAEVTDWRAVKVFVRRRAGPRTQITLSETTAKESPGRVILKLRERIYEALIEEDHRPLEGARNV